MIGRRDRRQIELFVAGTLRDLLPDDHVLVRVDRVLDLAWLEAEVADLYADEIGRPGIPPETVVRLMLAGLLTGIVHDRRLMREAQVNLAIRWFAGYALHERLPDHSSLTRVRQRWGADRFRRIFLRSAQACVAAGIATGEVVHIDSSLVRADVGWDAVVFRHADAVDAANPRDVDDPSGDPPPSAPPTAPRGGRSAMAVCTTDPDATLTTNHPSRKSEPSYKHHTAVDGQCGVVLDVVVTTGAVHDTRTVNAQLDAIAAVTASPIGVVTMDASYAVTRVFAELEARRIEAVVPTKPERAPKRATIPVRRFKLDAKYRIVRCPAGRVLRPHGKPDADRFQHYRARATDCAECRLRATCFSPHMKRRAILLHEHHPAMLRARRKHARRGDRERALYRSHRIRVEGYHGEAKRWHGLARAVRRGLENMQIQAFLTATAVNLKRMATMSAGCGLTQSA